MAPPQPPPPSLPPRPPSAPSPPSSPPAILPEEIIEEILLRFPPGEPESLFRAALVCKPWCRLISGPHFRRRFRELHRTPPMLGFLCTDGFLRTNAFSRSPAGRFAMRVLDARHGRVLARRVRRGGPFVIWEWERWEPLVIWDPITDEQRVLPRPPVSASSYTAAVLCAGVGVCHHHDCNRGPFIVVFPGEDNWEDGEGVSETFVCTYSSDVDAWSQPISTPDNFGSFVERTVLVGNAIYFGIKSTNISLKYNLESHEMSWIQLPDECYHWGSHVLTTTEEGLLGLVTIFDSELAMWSRNGPPEVDAGWTKIRVIDLKTVLPLDTNGVFTSPFVVGFADGPGILFMFMNFDLYTIDLKTHEVEFYKGDGDIDIFSYTSFYTPELEAACAGEGPSEGGSRA